MLLLNVSLIALNQIIGVFSYNKNEQEFLPCKKNQQEIRKLKEKTQGDEIKGEIDE